MSVVQKNIDQIIRTKTTIDGTERLPARDNSGDFKITVTNLLKEFQQSGLRPLAITAASYTITDADLESYDIFIADTTSNSVAITIPDLATNYGALFKILYGFQVGTNIVTVNRAGSDTITSDALTSIELPVVGNFIELFASSVTGKYEILSESITCQLVLDTYAGYGSTDNRIMRFTNNRGFIGNCFSQNHDSGYNGATEGLEITINKSGLYNLKFVLTTNQTGDSMGLSLNSSQLTTIANVVNIQDMIAEGTRSGLTSSDMMSAVSSVNLSKNDIIRAHGDGINSLARVYFSVSYIKG